MWYTGSVRAPGRDVSSSLTYLLVFRFLLYLTEHLSSLKIISQLLVSPSSRPARSGNAELITLHQPRLLPPSPTFFCFQLAGSPGRTICLAQFRLMLNTTYIYRVSLMTNDNWPRTQLFNSRALWLLNIKQLLIYA